MIFWLLGFPLTLFIKRDPNLMLVIGRHGKVFADNSKYFFIHATQHAKPGHRVVFLTTDRTLRDAIGAAGGVAVLNPSLISFQLLLTCSTLVADMTDWIAYGAYQLSQGARIIQLWHGAPLKQIERDVHKARLANLPIGLQFCINVQKALLGRYPVYDAVIATSNAFIAHAFSRCFKAKHFIACGYPRNDVLLGWSKAYEVDVLLQLNVDIAVKDLVIQAKANGQKIALFVPTFRKDLSNPLAGELTIAKLSNLAVKLNMLIVLKLHPFMQGRIQFDQYPNVLNYEPFADVYPLIPLCDCLITDYSSIYFDYLLLDRPILFWAPDLEQYLAQDRAMYFDYESMAPGPICRQYDEFARTLTQLIEKSEPDYYSDQRAKVRQFTFDHVDAVSARRLLEILNGNEFTHPSIHAS